MMLRLPEEGARLDQVCGYVLLLLASIASTHTVTSQTTTTQMPAIVTTQSNLKLDYLFMSLGYDKRVRPNYGGPPVEVNVTMRILSISSVSEVMMDFTADFYFRQTWHDPRLAFRRLADVHTLYVGAEVSKKIWLPDTFFGNEKTAYFHEATTPNVFLRIDHSGEVYRSIRLTVTSSCPMKLQYFPMDQQRCTIEAESYGYNVKDIKYVWAHDRAVERDKDISLPQFDIVAISQKYRLEVLTSGTYSRLIAEIHFVRRMGYYLIQIYVPSSLTVIISWVSFWLHRNASPARVQLGVTTVLTMTTLMSSTKSSLPKVSYVKSIDIFLGTCFVMVFAALLEYATVGYLGKRIAMRKSQLQQAQARAQAGLFSRLKQTTLPHINTLHHHRPSSSMSNTNHRSAFDTTTLPSDFNAGPESPPVILDAHSHTKLHPVAPERAHTCQWLANQTLNTPNAASNRQLINQWQHNNTTTTTTDCGCTHTAPKLAPPPVKWMTSAMSDEELRRGHRRRAVEAATAAAAASFVNSHRRHRGLGPSTDTTLGPYAYLEPKKLRQIDTIFRIRPSDIDKYSRVVFPVCFICFQLMYWLVYLHISTFDDQNPGLS